MASLRWLVRYGEDAEVVWPPGERSREHFVEGGWGDVDLTDHTEVWQQIRRKLLVLLRDNGTIEIDDLEHVFAEKDHKFIVPAIGYHSRCGNIVVTQCPEHDETHISLTRQGHRIADAQ